MKARNWNIAAAVALVGLALLVGCGGDGDQGTASAPLTKAEFVKRANAICSVTNAKIQARGGAIFRGKGNKSLEVVAGELVNNVVVPGFEKEIREIRALGISPGERQEVEAILSLMEKAMDRMQRNPVAAQRSNPYRPSQDLAASYGITSCGHP